jgi:hypothetical protein
LPCVGEIFAIKPTRIGWAGHVARMRENISSYKVLAGIFEANRPVRISTRTWRNNIKMDLKKVRYFGVDWIHMAQDRV